MKRKVHGVVLLVVALLVLSHYVLRGWDRALWRGIANPELPGHAIGVVDGNTPDEVRGGQSNRVPLNKTQAGPSPISQLLPDLHVAVDSG
jgi:hypothetical protein